MLCKRRILDQYFFFSFMRTFLGASFMFVAIILLFDMMHQLKYFQRYNVPMSMVGEMYFYKAFLQFTVVAPAAGLFSVIYTLNRMARDNELVAIVNAGRSVYRLTMPVVLFAVLFSMLLVPFNDGVVFPAEEKAEKISDIARRRSRKQQRNQADVKLWGLHGMFYKARYFDARKQELRKLIILKRAASEQELQKSLHGDSDGVPDWLQQFTATLGGDGETARLPDNWADLSPGPTWKLLGPRFLKDVVKLRPNLYWQFRIEAERAVWDKKRQGWVLHKGRIRKFFADSELVIPFQTRFFPLNERPYDFALVKSRVNAMTTGEARRYIAKLKKAGKPHSKEQVEYYLKFSFPLVNFIIIIIGISFGSFSPRSVVVVSFFYAVMIYLVYYAIVAVGLSLGKLGMISPALGAWLGNIIFFVIGLGLLFFRKT